VVVREALPHRHLPSHPALFRAWLGDETETVQICAELAEIEQWWK
jgi:hypothetical protein